MPLTQLSLTAGITAAMSRANNVFASTTEGPTSLSFNLANISLSAWNQEFLQPYTLFAVAPSGLAATLASGGTLTAGTAYYYRVTAVGYNGFASSNETTGGNEATVTPTTGNQTASLSWTALTGAVSYNVYRGTATGAENVLLGNVTGTTFSDTGLAGTAQSPPGGMPNNYIEFDLSAFTTLVNESATPGHVLGILITTSGDVANSFCALAPGTTNGLVWFFGGAGQSVTIPINGVFLLCGPSSGSTGQALSSTTKTLRITNGGTQATTVSVAAITGP